MSTSLSGRFSLLATTYTLRPFQGALDRITFLKPSQTRIERARAAAEKYLGWLSESFHLVSTVHTHTCTHAGTHELFHPCEYQRCDAFLRSSKCKHNHVHILVAFCLLFLHTRIPTIPSNMHVHAGACTHTHTRSQEFKSVEPRLSKLTFPPHVCVRMLVCTGCHASSRGVRRVHSAATHAQTLACSTQALSHMAPRL